MAENITLQITKLAPETKQTQNDIKINFSARASQTDIYILIKSVTLDGKSITPQSIGYKDNRFSIFLPPSRKKEATQRIYFELQLPERIKSITETQEPIISNNSYYWSTQQFEKLDCKQIIKEQTNQIESLKQKGQQLFDTMIKNLTWQMSLTDQEIIAQNKANPYVDVFGTETPEEYRNSARRTKDQLLRQGKENFSCEYVETQIKNLSV